MSQLVEVRRKVQRAGEHIDNLKPFLPGRDTTIAPADTITLEIQPDRETYHGVPHLTPLTIDLRMGIGDAVHDLRSALDYLAFRLAVINGMEAKARESRKLAFLIHSDEQRFKSAAGPIKPLVGDCPVTEMERLQKYKGLDQRAESLWLVSELDNINKHRMIVVAETWFRDASVRVDYGDTVEIKWFFEPNLRAMQDGTQLFEFRVRPTPIPPQVKMEQKPRSAIVFTDTNGLR